MISSQKKLVFLEKLLRVPVDFLLIKALNIKEHLE